MKITNVNGFTTRVSIVRELKAFGHKFSALLTEATANPKIAKNGKMGVYTKALHLAPATSAGLSVKGTLINTCAMASPGCIAACLNTSGNPAYLKGKLASRTDKTQAYFNKLLRPAFMALLAMDIALTVRQAEKRGMQPGIRLNATSDIIWEKQAIEINGVKYANLMDAFPMVEFYDYTASHVKALKFAAGKIPANYHITYSRKENNDSHCRDVLAAGGNVAIVFDKKDIAAQSAIAAQHGFDAPLINADDHDFRPLDGVGVIAALYAKGPALKDQSGFVLRA